MALSSNSKKGLAIGALLPVLLSIYSESRQQAETSAQRSAAQFEERQKHREAVQARDLDGAKNFLVQVTGDGADPEDSRRDGTFCDHVYIASELVRLTTESTATRAAVVGALQYRSERPLSAAGVTTTGISPRPRICQCPDTLEQMQLNWRPGKKDTLAGRAVIEEMAETLDDAASKCSVDGLLVPQLKPASGRLSPPPPPPPPPPKRSLPRGGGGRGGAEPLPPVMALPPEEAASENCVPATQTTPAADGPATRVYIQIASEQQREGARTLQAALRGQGYVVPGIERVGSGASPSALELRYVYNEDRPAAEALLASAQAVITNCGIAPDTLPLTLAAPLSQYRSHSLRRSFELWFPRTSP